MISPLLNEIAMFGRYTYMWEAPFATGRLATRGFQTDVGISGMPPNSVGFTLFSKGTEYGAILHRAQIIELEITNRKTGAKKKVSYVNKHYLWLDRLADSIAAKIPIVYPMARRAP